MSIELEETLDCPGLAGLLAAAAAHEDAATLEHLDSCARCQALVLAARRRAAAVGDPGCDAAEILLAEVDDGVDLESDDRARLLVHLVACSSCRAGAGPLEPDSVASKAEARAPLLLPIVSRTTYQVDSELARGGMGRILRATDLRLGRAVAIKEVIPGGERTFSEAHGSSARLEREARLTARLNHPSIVGVHEAGIWPSGAPFFAMELVAGRSLDRAIAAAPDFAGRLALLPHAIAAADALAYAHSQGIVHRDLKPANVLVGSFGETVVIDWGLAKDLGDSGEVPDAGPSRFTDAGLTQHGAMIGTPAYMAPEQAAGEPVDRGADVYALGAMLYHLLAGRPPFVEPGSAAVLEAVRRGAPPPVDRVEPSVPAALATVVGKAMARAPGDRYPSAAELADDLRRFQAGQRVRAHEYRLVEGVRHWLAHRRVSVTVAVALAATLLATGAVGLRGVLGERDRAEAMNRRLVVERARAQVPRDPTAAVAWLRRLPEPSPEASAVAAEAEGEGVARHVLAGHATGVYHLAGNGRLVVSGAANGEIRLWDLALGTVRRLADHGGEVYELALSGDGATVAVAGARGLELVATRDGSRRPLSGHHGPVYTVGFAGDDELISGGEDGTARRWNLATGEGRRVFGAEDPGAASRGPVQFVRNTAAGARHVYTFHSEAAGLTVVLTGGGPIVAVDASGGVRWQGEHPGGMPSFYALAPRGDELATVGQDGDIRRITVVDGALRTVAHAPDVVRVELSPDGRWLAASSREPELRLWDLQHDQRERRLAGHTLKTFRVAWARDGSLLASAGHDGTVRVWDPEQGEQWTLRGHRAEVPWVVFGDGGVLLSLSVDGTARVWHPGRRAARVFAGHQGAVDAVRFGPRLATVGQDATLRVWDPAGGTHMRLEHPAAVRNVELGGRWAITTDAAHTCRLWDLGAGTARVLGGRAACAVAAAFDPEARRVALLARGGELTVWSTEGELLRTQSAVLGATWSGGQLFTVGRDGAVARDGAIVAHAREPRTALASGGRFVVREPGALAILDLATLSWTRVAAPEAPFMTMALAASGRLVVGDARGRLHVVDGGAHSPRGLVGHTRGVIAAALSVDGRWLASASQGELLLWDLERGGHRRLHGHAEWVNGLAFSPDGRQLASAGADGTLRLWPVETVASPEPTTAVLDDGDELVITPPRP